MIDIEQIAHHARMVLDPLRTPLIQKAIDAKIKKGDTIFDLGCGLGTLSFLSLNRGAKKIHACDIDESINIAAEIARSHNWLSKISFYKGLSSSIALPDKVDVILSETIGSLGFDENILPFVIDARKRFLKTGGVIIPGSLTLFLAPTMIPPPLRGGGQGAGANHLHPLPSRERENKKIKEVNFEIKEISPKLLMAKPQKYFTANFLTVKKPGFDVTKIFTVTNDGVISGFTGWCEIEWAPGIKTSTSPFEPQTHWKQAFLPIDGGLKVKRGDKVVFRLIMGPKDELFSTQTMIEWGFKLL